MNNDTHLRAFIENFLEKKQKRRFLELLDSKNGRHKFLQKLPDSLLLKEEYCSLIDSSQQNTATIHKLLHGYGAPDSCYVISEASELDDKFLPLLEAITRTKNLSLGTIISCIPGKLAFYQTDMIRRRYLIKKI